jgi:hypothetical protein
LGQHYRAIALASRAKRKPSEGVKSTFDCCKKIVTLPNFQNSSFQINLTEEIDSSGYLIKRSGYHPPSKPLICLTDRGGGIKTSVEAKYAKEISGSESENPGTFRKSGRF